VTLMQSGGTPDSAKLAGGIGMALGHTFFGLFVAIPCLVVYGFYRTRADKIATRAALVAEELLESLRPDPSDKEKERERRKKREAAKAKAKAAAEEA
jgi:biopolymer transport protein ExbB/TolQ